MQLQEKRDFHKAMAMELARDYCAKHGYNPTKLQAQRFMELSSCVCFAQPNGVQPNGLLNDIATQPLPTLIIKLVDGRLIFETTEYTDKYLKD